MATQPAISNETALTAEVVDGALNDNQNGDGGTQAVESADDDSARDYEGEARAHGWTPKEQFKGDPSRWVDAETFMRRADEVMPFLKKQNQSLKREIDNLKRTTKQLARAEQSAYQNAINDLKAQQRQAAEVGDMATYDAVGEKVEKLEKEAPKADAQHGEDPQDEFDNFREDNGWYDRGNLSGATDTEKDARAFADRTAERLARQGKLQELPPSEFFAEVARLTKDRFPALAGTQTRREKPASDVAGVMRNGANRNAKIGANLDATAKEHAERYMRMKIGAFKDCKTKQEAYDLFAKSYTGWNQ